MLTTTTTPRRTLDQNLDTRPVMRHKVESLEIDEGNREAWDEGNPDLLVKVHSPNSVTVEDDYVEWAIDNDSPRYFCLVEPETCGFRYDPATGEEISYG